MNICFITCFNKTIFFKKIADSLEKEIPNLKTFWISTSPKWSRYLVENGTSIDHITQINSDETLAENEAEEALNIISSAEEKNNQSANFIFLTDRIIKHWEADRASDYLLLSTKKIHETLTAKNINFVFGEATAFHEVLTAFLCKSSGVKFLKPHTIRIPTTHFAFFKGHLESELSTENITPTENEIKAANEQIVLVTEKNQKPDYFYLNNKRPSYLERKFISTILKKIPDSYAETKKNASEKSFYHHIFIEQKFLTPLKSMISTRLDHFDNPIKGEKFVLYTLHKQPEASIDVLGTTYSNQIELIRNISINTPRDYKIYVKEHSNAIGERSLNYLSQIKKIPNVRLINPTIDSHELIKTAELILTISGTIAFEAALYGKKSATFAPMFFNSINNCYHIKSPSAIPQLLTAPLINNTDQNKTMSLAAIISNSFLGTISDPVSLPSCISDENINNVSAAFATCINSYHD